MKWSDCIETITSIGAIQLPPLTWRQWLSEGVDIAGRDIMRLVGILERWSDRARERRNLMGLDDRLMKDVGLSRADIARECGKPFWRA